MSTDYTAEIVVSNTPQEAYLALTQDFAKWWTTSCNPISKVGENITFRFGPSYWVMVVNSLVPNKSVELECVEANHIHNGLPSSILEEWKGTKLRWEIDRLNEDTKIVFIHEGLVPSLDCYEVCEQGWSYFFAKSLKQYLDDGEGFPFNNEA